MSAAPEISPQQLEAELRSSTGVPVVDVRDRDAFAAWHLDPANGRLINVPQADLEADPAAVAAGIGSRAGARYLQRR